MEPSIRPATAADTAAIRRIYVPFVEETAISFETDPPANSEIQRRIETKVKRYPWLVCTREGVVGYAYAGPHRDRDAYRWSVDVSVYVDPAHHRRGIARALYTALFALLESQGFVSAYAGIALPNPASTSFHESMDFEPVGTYHGVGYKHGEWHDVRWYERALGNRLLDPNPSTDLPDLDRSAIESALETGQSFLDF